MTSSGSDNKITLDDQFDFSPSKRYAIRRKLKKAISNAAPLEFGNNILTSDVQNVYNESDENMYVASGSLPSHIISRNLSVIGISSVTENGTIQGFNALTKKYSVIFGSNIPFVTGDKIYYQSSDPLVGLTQGFYYIKKISDNKIKLFKHQAFIEADDFIEFDVPTNKNTSHNFTLASHYNKSISTQKLLKKYPLNVQQNLGKGTETISGPVGMLINGVEIENGNFPMHYFMVR